MTLLRDRQGTQHVSGGLSGMFLFQARLTQGRQRLHVHFMSRMAWYEPAYVGAVSFACRAPAPSRSSQTYPGLTFSHLLLTAGM